MKKKNLINFPFFSFLIKFKFSVIIFISHLKTHKHSVNSVHSNLLTRFLTKLTWVVFEKLTHQFKSLRYLLNNEG